MSKIFQTFLVLAVVGLAILSSMLFSKYQTTRAMYASSKFTDPNAGPNDPQNDSRYARTIDAIAEIQDSLDAISSAEGDTSSVRAEHSMSGNGPEALDRLSLLRASVTRNKQRILQLESSLRAGGIHVAGLTKMIRSLKKNVADKELLIAALGGQVDSLQTQVTGLSTTLATTVRQNRDSLQVRDQVIEERRRELATVYYIMGDRAMLQRSGVITASGGLLGMGKTLLPTGRGSDDRFTPLDTDQQTVVPIPTARARVLSAQPPASYRLVPVGGTLELHILDPKAFRKVKDVVIVTA